MIAFTCPECGERPVEVVCIADSDTSFWFNPWGGLDCDEPGEFRCGPCAVASGAVCMLIPPSERRSWEHLAGLVKLRRWEPGEPDRPILAEVDRAVREALTGEGGVRREGQAQGGNRPCPTCHAFRRVPVSEGGGYLNLDYLTLDLQVRDPGAGVLRRREPHRRSRRLDARGTASGLRSRPELALIIAPDHSAPATKFDAVAAKYPAS